MCIACELQLFFAMEDLPPSTGTASHVDTRAGDGPRFVCEAPEDKAPEDLAPVPVAQPIADERKPKVTSRE